MVALVETLFSANRMVPWHGLGTIIDECPTSKDAIELAGLNWEVNSNPIFDQNGNEIKGFKANTRSTDDSILGIVSDRYKIVQNIEAFEFTDSLIENEEMRYETAGSLRFGKQVWILAKMPETMILDDKVDPYICFSNTHDGTGAIKVCMTPIRVVCANTLNAALANASRSWSTKHMGDLAGKLHEARQTLMLANKYMEELDKAADIYANTKINDDEIQKVIKELFPVDIINDSARKINNVQQLTDNFYTCYNMPDIAKFRGTQWGVINAMADMVSHMTPSRNTSSYQENNWGRIMNGHPFFDATIKKMNELNMAA